MIAKLIAEWARVAPNRTALIYNGRPSSFQTFANAISSRRAALARLQIFGDGIAVVAVRDLSIFWVTSLALRSLGLTTVSINTVEALTELGLPDIRAVVAHTQEAWDGLAAACERRGIALVSLPTEDRGETDGEDGVKNEGGHILQTSGTTGAYKKILIEPSFETSMIALRKELFGLSEQSVFNVFSFPAWTGAGYKSPVSTWAAGGCVIIQQAAPFFRSLKIPGQTHAALGPSMLATVLAAPPDAYPRNPALQLSLVAGSVTQAQIDHAKERITPNILNRLGATETSVFGFTRLDEPEDNQWHALVENRGVEIVGENDAPVPTGEIGRLRVSTSGGPSRYLYDDETSRAFFKNGFFYPGDLGMIRSDGRLALRGRTTDIISVQGVKISPAPIEQLVQEAFGFTGVCLFATRNSRSEDKVCLVIETSGRVDRARLLDVLRSARRDLGEFPDVHIRCVESIPRNAMGKVLRQAVRALVPSSEFE